ncbi:MAG: AIR synthase-related protein [Candidatus Woesearchaeota archaeon]
MGSVYADAGVDFGKEHDVVGVFTRLFKQTKGNVKDLEEYGFSLPQDIGHFADGITVDNQKLMQMKGNEAPELKLLKATDGAGTKPLAHQLYRHVGGDNPEALASVGVDTVAMVVNDLLCAGARPVMLTDYVAWADPNVEIAKDLASGLLIGANHSGAVVIGGENASLREMIKGVSPELAYDICGDAMGVIFNTRVARRLEQGKETDASYMIEAGDPIIGVRSSGIHCNGISLARKEGIDYEPMGWEGKYGPAEKISEFGGRTMLEEILTPTLTYMPLLSVVENGIENDSMAGGRDYKVKAVANITGEGVENLHRCLGKGKGAELDFSRVREPHAIFPVLQDLGGVSTHEMYNDFNMGWGLYMITSKGEEEKAMEDISSLGFEPEVIGRVNHDKGTIRVKAHDKKEMEYKRE